MAQVRLRPPNPAVRIIFDGQSHWNIPSSPTLPQLVMSGRGIPFHNVSVPATSWSGLSVDVATRVYPYLQAPAGLTVVVLMGGSTDLVPPESDTGQTVFDEAVAYADDLRANGADLVVAGTIPPIDNGSIYTPTQDTERLAHNSLLLADAASDFDATFDLASDPFDDPLGTMFGVDGTHFSALGQTTAAPIVWAAIDAAIP